MATRPALRGVRCGVACLLLAGSAIAFESLATPVLHSHKGWSRDAASDDRSHDYSPRSDRYLPQAERWWSLPPGLAFGEIRTDSGAPGRWLNPNEMLYGAEGYADLPAQFDNSFGPGNTLYHELLRKRGTVYGDPTNAPEWGAGGMIESALRNAWDSIADESNTANISLAGIDLSLMVRGDQRLLLVNGYDVLSMISPGAQNQDAWQDPARAASHAGEVRAAGASPVSLFGSAPHDGGNVVSELKVAVEAVFGFVSHPLTIFVTLAYVLMWLSVRVMQALRDRRRSYRRYRR